MPRALDDAKRHVALKASDDAKGVSKVPNLLWSDGAFDAFTRCLIFRVFALNWTEIWSQCGWKRFCCEVTQRERAP